MLRSRLFRFWGLLLATVLVTLCWPTGMPLTTGLAAHAHSTHAGSPASLSHALRSSPGLSQPSDQFRACVEKPAPQISQPIPPPKPQAEPLITIEAFQFAPEVLEVKQGTTVTFVNQDSTPHTATPQPGADFTGTGRIAFNERKTITFNTVGEQGYFCEIHPSMMGKVIVIP